MGIISFRQSFRIVRNAPSYIFAISYSFPVCVLIISFFSSRFKNFTLITPSKVTVQGEEEIRFFPNEHFLDQQDEADKERITDTNFTVFAKVPKKYHVECESSLLDGKIAIRLFEYDAQTALDEGEVTEETERCR